MRVVRNILLTLLAVAVGAVAVLWLGSVTSLDHQYQHTSRTAQLPDFDPTHGNGDGITLSRIQANGMQFRTRSAGFGTRSAGFGTRSAGFHGTRSADFDGNRGNVILLHGFPETSAMWEVPMLALADAGFRVLAFDQRGYSPGARPAPIDAYAIDHLVADVFAVADAAGFDRFHLAGHDWGAGVGWTLVMTQPQRLDSWTSLSIPHLMAYGEAILNDPDQQSRSSYIGFFRTPWVPEVLFTFNRLSLLRSSVYADHAGATLDEYLDVFAEPGALSAALNWYRAGNPSTAASQNLIDPHIQLPVLFIWGRDDPVVGQRALDTQRDYFEGPYRELELDTGHWLLQTRADTVSAALVSFLEQLPAGG